ncbi:YtxH domain-containing protein [Oceanobacillus bengalensis]|uniref:YtxH domain-containing protein n=1 Tax=Oceanobacillus bengalensis TaxID=1435466 RepID=A0A494YW00_9BACI|nr:YtxH domain-containing protein [Oceanobacillus bengalensis]RKQ14386.1 YtxH domain-containing protein [Oceanobacillus bengalensis]
MGRSRLIVGTVIGAAVGAVVALCDKDTREYAKLKLNDAKTSSAYYIKHPSEAIENVRQTMDKLNQNISSGADNAINALEQVEDTIEKLTNKN